MSIAFALHVSNISLCKYSVAPSQGTSQALPAVAPSVQPEIQPSKNSTLKFEVQKPSLRKSALWPTAPTQWEGWDGAEGSSMLWLSSILIIWGEYDWSHKGNEFISSAEWQTEGKHALLTFPKATRSRDTRKYCYALKPCCKGPKIWEASEIFTSEHFQCQEVDAFIFSNLCGPQPWAGSPLCFERK